jgi:peptide/nickel transport system permease protein
MARYVVARLIATIPVLFLVTLVTFVLIRVAPGDVVSTRLGENATARDVAALRTQLGLDDPLPVQYLRWLVGLVTGDPGRSLTSNLSVSHQFWLRLPVSLELGVLSILLSVMIGVPLGVLSAVRSGHLVDHVVRIIAVLGQAVPNFWLGILSLTLLSISFSWVPPFTHRSLLHDPKGNIEQFALPCIITGYALSAIVMRLTRSAMLEVLSQDYIRTARAKGLKHRAVVFQHAMRNALIPIVTIVGAQVSVLIGGTVIVETIFSLQGVGRLTFQAINDRDYTQLQFNVVAIATVVVLANLVVDLSYGYLDPRLRSSG